MQTEANSTSSLPEMTLTNGMVFLPYKPATLAKAKEPATAPASPSAARRFAGIGAMAASFMVAALDSASAQPLLSLFR